MQWAIVQYDNRPLTDDFKALQKRNMEYCKNMDTYIYFLMRTILFPRIGLR